MRETSAALETATAAHSKAEQASQEAVAGNGGDPAKAEDALEAAAKAKRVAQKVADAAVATFQREHGREAIVRGMAHRGVYERGIALRVAAARAGDAARAALAAAQSDYEAACKLMEAARNGGLPDLHGALSPYDPNSLRTEAQERAIWVARHVDPDAPKHPWQPE